MFSPEFMRFIVEHGTRDFEPKEKKTEVKESFLCRFTKLATVPINIKKY